MQRLRIVFSLVISTVLSSSVFAQPTASGVTDDDLQLNTITTALPFMSITPDSRAGGMGDAGTALSGGIVVHIPHFYTQGMFTAL